MSWNIPHIEVIITWIVCLILFIISAFLQSKRAPGRKLVRRLLFLLIGLIGIGLIITKPTTDIDTPATIVQINTSIDSASSINPSVVIDRSFDNVHSFLGSDISDKTSEVHITGIGLSKADLDLLQSYRLSYHPAPTIPGITNVEIPMITERQRWTIGGSYQGEDITEIFLKTTDQKSHQAVLSDNTFQIISTAPVAGAYLVQLSVVLNGQDTITELFPIEVFHEPKWQMLVLASSPSFEINYLKNYWTSLGNGFTLRSKVSKDKFKTSFVNSQKANLDKITRNVLLKYDFLIIDGLAWNQLSNLEQETIKRVVYNDGLALLVRPDESNSTWNNLSIPQLDAPTDLKWRTASNDINLTRYPIRSSWSPIRLRKTQLARYRQSGLGYIGILGIEDTYKLILANQQRDYQNLWSTIFSNLFRDFSLSARFIYDEWHWAGDPTILTVLAKENINEPPLLNDSLSLTYIEVPFLKGVTETTLIPEQGYNYLSINTSHEGRTNNLTFYAHKTDTWPALRQLEYKTINETAVQYHQNSIYESPKITKLYPLWWWYLLFLIGFGCLWFDERVSE